SFLLLWKRFEAKHPTCFRRRGHFLVEISNDSHGALDQHLMGRELAAREIIVVLQADADVTPQENGLCRCRKLCGADRRHTEDRLRRKMTDHSRENVVAVGHSTLEAFVGNRHSLEAAPCPFCAKGLNRSRGSSLWRAMRPTR